MVSPEAGRGNCFTVSYYTFNASNQSGNSDDDDNDHTLSHVHGASDKMYDRVIEVEIAPNKNVGSVVEWLKRRACDQHGLGSKTHSRHSVVSLGKTLYGTFPCLVDLASSSKLKSYLY